MTWPARWRSRWCMSWGNRHRTGTESVAWSTVVCCSGTLPSDRAGWHYLVCGPGSMIASIARGLDELGVPTRQRHSEIFDIA